MNACGKSLSSSSEPGWDWRRELEEWTMVVVVRLKRLLQVGTLALLNHHHHQRCHCFVASVVEEEGVLGSFECCCWWLVERNTGLDLLIPFSSPSIFCVMFCENCGCVKLIKIPKLYMWWSEKRRKFFWGFKCQKGEGIFCFVWYWLYKEKGARVEKGKRVSRRILHMFNLCTFAQGIKMKPALKRRKKRKLIKI